MKDVKLHELFLLFALPCHLVMFSSRYKVSKSPCWVVSLPDQDIQVMLQNRPTHFLYLIWPCTLLSTHLSFAKTGDLLIPPHIAIFAPNAHNQNRLDFSPLDTLNPTYISTKTLIWKGWLHFWSKARVSKQVRATQVSFLFSQDCSTRSNTLSSIFLH